MVLQLPFYMALTCPPSAGRFACSGRGGSLRVVTEHKEYEITSTKKAQYGDNLVVDLFLGFVRPMLV